jgi:hypothetical protein
MKERVLTRMSLVILACLSISASCGEGNVDDDNESQDTGTGEDQDTGSSAEGSEFDGQWSMVEFEESWYEEVDGVVDEGSDSMTADGVIDLLVIDGSSMTWYSYIEDEGCYYIDEYTIEIAADGTITDNLNDLSGTTTEEGVETTVTSTFEMSGDNLVFSSRYEFTGDNESGWEEEIGAYEPYTGDVPPSDWPAECK